jgi:uncharacterized protein
MCWRGCKTWSGGGSGCRRWIMTIDTEYAAPAPVFEVDGKVIPGLARDVARLRISEDTSGLRHLEAEFQAFGPGAGADDELLYLDRRIFDFGRALRVSIGVPSQDRVVFIGSLSDISVTYGNGTPPIAGISAEDSLMRLRMTRRCRTYEDMSDGDAIAQVGRDHGLRTQIDLDGPTYDVIHQVNQTDLAFIRERARTVNGEIWSRTNRDGRRIRLHQSVDLVGVTARADLAHQRTEVAVSGYDAQDRSSIRESANGSVAQAEVHAGQLGTAVLERTFGSLSTARAADVPLTSEEARSWAKGEMLERARRFVTVSGVTRGTPEMGVGSTLELIGVAPIFDGDGYYVTSFCHRYDNINGFSTAFEAERATIGGSR